MELTQRASKIGASVPPPKPLAAARTRIGLHWVLMAMWEMTITCHDGTRLRLSELRDPAPQKGDVVETLDTGQIIKARIDFWREEKVGGSRPPLFQVTADRNLRSTEVRLSASTALDATKQRNTD